MTDDIVAFYSLDKYGDKDGNFSPPKVGDNMEYQGFYSKTTDKLYDTDYSISNLFGIDSSDLEKNSFKALEKELTIKVIDSISEHIHKNPSLVQGAIPERELDTMDLRADRWAEEAFFKGETSEDIVYYPSYETDFDQTEIFDYLVAPEKTIATKVDHFFEFPDNHSSFYSIHDQMATGLAKEELARGKFKEIINDPGHPFHKRRDIAEAVEASGAKSVKVNIDKDGKSFTFTTEAGYLECKNSNYYSSYGLTAKDRTKFYNLYSRQADYSESDVVSISYRGKEIYNREEMQAKREASAKDLVKEQGAGSLAEVGAEAKQASQELASDSVQSVPAKGDQVL